MTRKRWTDAETETLRSLVAMGHAAPVIAKEMGRNIPTVRRRMQLIGVCSSYRNTKKLGDHPTKLRRGMIKALNGNECAWPIGDPREDGFDFCRAKSADGKPYCAHHMSVAYIPLSSFYDKGLRAVEIRCEAKHHSPARPRDARA